MKQNVELSFYEKKALYFSRNISDRKKKSGIARIMRILKFGFGFIRSAGNWLA